MAGPDSHLIFSLEYVDEMEGKTCVIPDNTALMFCYFNNNQYFHQYLSQYRGKGQHKYLRIITVKHISGICVILIGPIDGARHCDPEPGYLEVFILQKKI